MKRDGATDKKFVQILVPAARTADANGDLDLAAHGYPQKVTIVVDMGAEGVTLSGTDKIEVCIRHGAAATPTTGVSATDVVIPASAPAGIVPAAPGAGGLVAVFDANSEIPGIFHFGYVGSARYVNVLIDYSGTHGTATPNAVHAILEGLTNTPDA